MFDPDPSVLALLSVLGAEHGGCISATQLREAGISKRRADSLRDRGALTLVVPGIDAVGPPPLTPTVVAHAGVLRGGAEARLGGRTGLEWRGLLPAEPSLVTISTQRLHLANRERFDVRAPVESMSKVVIELRPTRRVTSTEVINGARVAPVIEGLLALAAEQKQADLRRAWREADFQRLLSETAIEAALGPGVEGTKAIRELMRREPILGSEYDTLSRAERHLLAGMRRRGLLPEVNARVRVGAAVARPDFYFALERLVVEVDGGGHDSPARQAEDLARAKLLATIGIPTKRYADVEVWRDTEACLDEITAELARRRLRAA